MTTYTDQLYQYGGCPVNGMLTNGQPYFVSPYFGGDSNHGVEISRPKKSVKSALSACVAGHNDVVYLLGYTNTLATTEDAITSTVLWNKDSTHLIGVNSGNNSFQRSTIRPISTATAANVAPVMTISANNCRFENISIVNDLNAAAAVGGVKVTGSRNHFVNCHFAGNVGGTTSDVNTNYSLTLDGAQENLFENCVIGVDTNTRTNQLYEIRFMATAPATAAVARNVFRNCVIMTFAGAGTMTWLTVSTNGQDRWNLFDRCTFVNAVGSTATSLTQGFSIAGGSPAGVTILKDCLLVGATASESAASGLLYKDSNDTRGNTTVIGQVT